MLKQSSIICLSILITISACSGTDYQKQIKSAEKTFYQGEYLNAARKLLKHVNTSGKDQLLFMMECGYMLHAGGEYEKSNQVLLKAAKLAEITPISISKQASALLTNNTKTNYRGEDFEKVLIHMYLGINFLMLKKYEKARVEFKKVNNELAKIKTENGKARYKQNIMAKYMTAIAYEIIGDLDNDQSAREFAYVEYKQIYNINPRIQMVYTDLQRMAKKLGYMDDYADWKRKFGKKDYVPNDYGELVVIFQAGQSPVKKSRGKLMSDRTMKNSIMISLRTTSLAAGMTIAAVVGTLRTAENPIPRYARRSNLTRQLNIAVGNNKTKTLMLENIENTAIRNLKDDYKRLQRHVASSVVVKAVASIAAGLATKAIVGNKNKGLGSLLGLVVGAGTGAALFSSMKPDLRCWHTLPANLQLARIFLKPGTYQAELSFRSKSGAVQNQKKITIKIEKNRKTFINERTLK